MCDFKKLEQHYIIGLKNGNSQDRLTFTEILEAYDGIVYFYKFCMKKFSHCLTNKVYDLCFLLHIFYSMWNDYYKNLGILAIDEKFIENVITKLNGKINQDTIKSFKQIIQNVLGKSSIEDIKKGLDKINDCLMFEVKNELIKQSLQEINDYCKDIVEDDIIEKINNLFEYEDIGEFEHEILQEQIKNNHTPDITKEEFFEKYLEFKKAQDKHGLIDLSFDNFELLKRYNLEGVYYRDYFIYFDDLFRFWDRRLFLDSFLKLSRQGRKDTIFKIKLNYDKIISLKKFKHVMLIEGAYFGPDYNPDKFFITENKKPVLTIKIRESEKFNECFGNYIERTEFKFDPKNNSFLIEEVGKNECNGYYINRLAHSEFNTECKKVKHFDGSLLFYNIDCYCNRENANLLKQEKIEEHKTKLFQIDGEININEWEDLLLAYYDGNELVLEYLDEESYKNNYKDILS